MTKSCTYCLLLLCLLWIPLQGLAQSSSLEHRAYRLQLNMQSNHLQPREVNDALGQDIHERLLYLIDEDRMVFEAADIAELRALSDTLDDNLQRQERTYIDRFIELYILRAEETVKIVEEITVKQPDVFTAKGNEKTPENYAPDRNARKQRWQDRLLSNLRHDVVEELKADEVLTAASVRTATEKHWEDTKKSFVDFAAGMKDLEENMELYYLNAITLAYDPHSSYFNDAMNEEFSEELNSTQFVFGITYGQTMNGGLEITEVLPGSSAWFSEEVQEGALIKSIRSSVGQFLDTRNVKPGKLSEFFDELESDTISLELEYEGEEKFVDLVRSRVYSDNDIIKTALLKGDHNIGYISMPDFYTSWTDTSDLGCANDVAKAIIKLKKANIEGLILDLRDNGGGSLKEAVDLVGVFIDFGPVLLIKDPNGEVQTLKDFNRGSIYTGPLMILINSESASASEVVAGTLQDYNRALIVGQTSFGKATGQSIQALNPRQRYLGVEDQDQHWGHVKTTDIGLYRLTKETAQARGVVPDLVIPSLSFYPSTYEAEEAHVLYLDSIDKKVYFTPLPSLPGTALRNWYTQRKNPSLDSVVQLVNNTSQLVKSLEDNMELQRLHAAYKQLATNRKEMERLQETFPFDFAPLSFQFDAEILRMSPYLERYNTQFLERLGHDIELNEGFNILQHLIGISQ